MADGIQLPSGYEDATAVAGPLATHDVSLPPGYEDATPVKGPLAPQPGGVARTLNKIGETGADVATGMVKGVGDTVSGVSHLIHKIPVVGETLAPEAGIKALDTMTPATNIAQSVGKGLETTGEFALTAGATSELAMVKELMAAEKMVGAARAAKYVDLARKYPLLAQTFNLATQHPWLAKMILGAGIGAVSGGATSTVKGAQQDEAVASGAKGAAVGAATGAVSETIIPAAVSWLRKNPFRGIIQGAEAAQPAAKAAVGEAAEAAAKDSGPAGVFTPRTPANGIRTMVDDPIAQVATRERAGYDILNKAASEPGKPPVDMKNLYEYRMEVQDALDDPTNIANREKLNVELNRTNMQIANGEASVQSQLGADAKTVLRNATRDTQQRYALQELKKAVFNNEGVVSGNVAHGVDESINIKNAITKVENLDKPSRYAPEGSPTRLQQALGTDGAKTFKDNLYAAQKAGQTYAKRNVIAKWLAGLAGAGAVTGAYEVLKP